MRTQTRIFSASTVGIRDTGNVNLQGSGQEALAEDETPPGCEAYEEIENRGILMLGLDSLQSDGTVEGGRKLIDSGEAHSACPPQFCPGTTTRPSPDATPFRAANGATIKRFGERTIRLQRQGTSIDVNFQVVVVHRPIIAVRELTAMGCEVEFSRNGTYILKVGRWKLEQGRLIFAAETGLAETRPIELRAPRVKRSHR